MFWIFPIWADFLSNLTKVIIAAVLVGVFVWAFYKPVRIAYGKRNSESDVKQTAQLATPEKSPTSTPHSEPPKQAVIIPKKKKPATPKPIPQEQPPASSPVPPSAITQNCPQGISKHRTFKGWEV
jgi:hypothetical protein